MRAFAFGESMVLLALFIPAPGCSGSGGAGASSEGDGSNGGANDAGFPNDVETDADNAMDAAAAPFTDPYGGASGCDGGVVVAPKPCKLMMPVSGAFSGTLLGGEGCQWGNAGNAPLLFGTGELGPAPWHGTEVEIRPQQPINVGSVGLVGSVEVLITAYPPDGGQMQWVTPFTCSVRIYSDACVRDASTAGLYALAGTGTCGDVAQPVGGMGPPVTIGEFSFALEYASP